jgi:hypothetical protein
MQEAGQLVRRYPKTQKNATGLGREYDVYSIIQGGDPQTNNL